MQKILIEKSHFVTRVYVVSKFLGSATFVHFEFYQFFLLIQPLRQMSSDQSKPKMLKKSHSTSDLVESKTSQDVSSTSKSKIDIMQQNYVGQSIPVAVLIAQFLRSMDRISRSTCAEVLHEFTNTAGEKYLVSVMQFHNDTVRGNLLRHKSSMQQAAYSIRLGFRAFMVSFFHFLYEKWDDKRSKEEEDVYDFIIHYTSAYLEECTYQLKFVDEKYPGSCVERVHENTKQFYSLFPFNYRLTERNIRVQWSNRVMKQMEALVAIMFDKDFLAGTRRLSYKIPTPELIPTSPILEIHDHFMGPFLLLHDGRRALKLAQPCKKGTKANFHEDIGGILISRKTKDPANKDECIFNPFGCSQGLNEVKVSFRAKQKRDLYHDQHCSKRSCKHQGIQIPNTSISVASLSTTTPIAAQSVSERDSIFDDEPQHIVCYYTRDRLKSLKEIARKDISWSK